MDIVYCDLPVANVDRIREIDREEEVSGIYEYQNGSLRLKPERIFVKEFPSAELEAIIQRQIKLLLQGGKVIGAFKGSLLVGVVSVENKLRGTISHYCKMDILYVSKRYRGMGIARSLVERSKLIASEFGAAKLYISSTPSKNTVDFYLKQNATLVKEVDKELFTLEPKDIHLEMIL